MYTVIVGCEKGATAFSGCIRSGMGWRTEDPSQPMPEDFRASLVTAGWVERDGKHYCPQHNPDLVGEQVTISRDYVEVAPGVRVRWPQAREQGDTMQIEVQHAVPADVQSAVQELLKQREEDPGPGRYDMVEQRNIDTLIDYARGLS